jgi:hypothetical protein
VLLGLVFSAWGVRAGPGVALVLAAMLAAASSMFSLLRLRA